MILLICNKQLRHEIGVQDIGICCTVVMEKMDQKDDHDSVCFSGVRGDSGLETGPCLIIMVIIMIWSCQIDLHA